MNAGWPSPEVEALAEWIRTRTGLTFPSGRLEPAAGSLVAVLGRFGSVDIAIDRLSRDQASLDELLAELTIGETYFFRHPEQFQIIRSNVLPAFRSRRGPVRVWSAGCATGEEAYSLAMVLREEGIPATKVLGTDLSRARLAVARRGSYRKWSFRGVPQPIIERYFRPAGAWHQLTADVRAEVDFRYLNLVEDRYPSATAGIWGMDVILCRNVLIYLDRRAVARVARQLVESLSEDGWLFLGASDPSIADLAPVDVVVTDAGLLYRRVKSGIGSATEAVPDLPWKRVEPPLRGSPDSAIGTGQATTAKDPQWPERSPPLPAPVEAQKTTVPQAADTLDPALATEELNLLYWEQQYARVVTGARKIIESGRATEDIHVLLGRSLANQGKSAEAGRATAEALESFPESAELHYLHSVLLLESGRPSEAAVAARRALYLRPDLAVAHLAFADAALRNGNRSDCRRALRNAERLLEKLSPDETIAAADGETAARLLRIAQFRLKLLEDEAVPNG